MSLKKGIFDKNLLFVCGVLAVFAIGLATLIAGGFIWFRGQNEIVKVNATETTIAHITQQAQYEFIDPFNENAYRWFEDSVDDEYMTGSIKIEEGIYKWDVWKIKQPFIYWAGFYLGDTFKDFDIYVDTKIEVEIPGDACSGFVFRKPSYKLEEGAYIYSVCNDSSSYVFHINQDNTDIIKVKLFDNAFKNNDWNHLEISARGDHFIFMVNYKIVFEMTDDQQPIGGLGLLIDVRKQNPAIISFDNYGFQRH